MSRLLTPRFVRENFLAGLVLEDGDGRPMRDAVIEGRIKGVTARFERQYGVRLTPTAVKLGLYPLENEIEPGEVLVPAVVDDAGVEIAPAVLADPLVMPGLDYNPDRGRDNHQFSMELPLGPVRNLRAFGLWLPGQARPVSFPTDWVHCNPRSHRVRVYPGRTLTTAFVFASGIFANIVSASRPIPYAWHASYVAGYSDSDLAGRDYDVLEALGKMVACEVLIAGSIDRNLAAGITQKAAGVDGLSQSVSLIQNAAALKYAPLIASYQQELDAWEKTFFRRRTGIRLGVA